MQDDLMYNTAGLMGALAGIGDAIDSGTVQYIFIAIAVPWAQQGSPLGALFPFICFALYQVSLGMFRPSSIFDGAQCNWFDAEYRRPNRH